ncbi:hypothetical protein NE236_37505 [Actinoallomurus purpureus]|uniref:prenyltransferase/squalene oxidase repeat-containing protein n=1 Tax=Actinoallomurus purpureus TaxID=478114 RepID=UPI002093CCB5|nr:prenyltransferase/squalene oxidase repeat-containing protein [Actinoallomurus purpureus]MCO6010670.1 hypothetical protein [Actinoallomurus purpureus]
MTPGDPALAPMYGDAPRSEADTLIAGLVAEPWGQVSASVYETGRLVTLAPWLTGHADRVRHLLRTQRADGGWGAVEPGYALVPTLSATEALLGEAHRGGATVDAAAAGLRRLFRWSRGGESLTAADLPDLPAIELIVPSLIASINTHLSAGVISWPETERLNPPRGLTGTALTSIRAALASGQALPQKLLHVLEAVGDSARRHPAVRPEVTGAIGASPAATAAWLGDRPWDTTGSVARRFLETVAGRNGGPVPCGLPITVFERAWVLSGLARAGVPFDPPHGLVAELSAAVGPAGTAAAAGLPVDADTTAGALYALALVGVSRPPDPLWTFETESHFSTWPGEDGVSVTTNAHVLQAFGQYRGHGCTGPAARYAATIAKVSAWLRDRQRSDGSWWDRWHASPYYATFCCVLALHDFGGPESTDAVDRAVRWVLATQRADGSWGRWTGTAEETAYALQILLLTRDRGPGTEPRLDAARLWAAVRGRDHLRRCPAGPDDPPLWHDKDLYLPVSIVRSATLAALHLSERVGSPSCQLTA